MDRGELLSKLEVARPGLSNRDFIPILTHFCFTSGKSVLTYNDLIAIRVPCSAPIEGAVKGTLLLSLLGSIDASDVAIKQDSKAVHLQAGKSNMNLPYLPASDFLFSFPTYSTYDPLPFDETRKRQLDRCLLTCGVDTSQAQYMGVTINVGDSLSMYSTNGRAVTAYRDDTTISVPDNHPIASYPLILPLEFCKVVSDLWDTFGDGNLWFDKDRSFVVAQFDGCEVFSKLSAAAPPDFERVVSKHMKDIKTPVAIPEGFSSALHRASVILASEHSRAALDIGSNVMAISAQSSYGKVDDTLDASGHPDVAVSFDPALVKMVLEGMSSIYVVREAVYVTDGSVDHLVANYTE